MAEWSDAKLREITEALDLWGNEYDLSGQWPEKSVKLIAEHGAWRWNLPAEYGGDPVSHAELLRIYEALSAGCMNTSLVSTQRDGAVELIAGSDNETMKRRYLPRLATGDIYTTVGISHLTTSKRGGGHLMKVRPDGDGYRMEGMIPWATGAERAAVIVTGGVLPDGDQILACAPTDRDGLSVDEPADLLVLNPSRTSCVQCRDYRLEADEIIRGPMPKVLTIRTPVKPLVTSACGLGVAGALLSAIKGMPAGALELFSDAIEPLSRRYEQVRKTLYSAARRLHDPEYEVASTDVRVQVNELVLRLAITALTLSKGSGFMRTHPLQRHAREALFFLVWSATSGTQIETLSRLLSGIDSDMDRDDRAAGRPAI